MPAQPATGPLLRPAGLFLLAAAWSATGYGRRAELWRGPHPPTVPRRPPPPPARRRNHPRSPPL
eukprot:6838918-Lingulodinium_polyedra.AAC.1